ARKNRGIKNIIRTRRCNLVVAVRGQIREGVLALSSSEDGSVWRNVRAFEVDLDVGQSSRTFYQFSRNEIGWSLGDKVRVRDVCGEWIISVTVNIEGEGSRRRSDGVFSSLNEIGDGVVSLNI